MNWSLDGHQLVHTGILSYIHILSDVLDGFPRGMFTLTVMDVKNNNNTSLSKDCERRVLRLGGVFRWENLWTTLRLYYFVLKVISSIQWCASLQTDIMYPLWSIQMKLRSSGWPTRGNSVYPWMLSRRGGRGETVEGEQEADASGRGNLVSLTTIRFYFIFHRFKLHCLLTVGTYNKKDSLKSH